MKTELLSFRIFTVMVLSLFGTLRSLAFMLLLKEF